MRAVTFALVAAIGASSIALGAGSITSAQAPRTVWRGAFSNAQADRGAIVYGKHCTVCHSDNFLGNIDGGPPLIGKDFETRWNGMSLLDIVNQVSGLMPSTDPGSVPRKEWVELFAFLFRANGATMSPTDLPDDDESLAAIQGTVKP